MLKLSNLWIFHPYISKGAIETAAENKKDLYEKNHLVSFDFISTVLIWFIAYASITEKQLLPPSHAWMVFHTNPRKFRHFWTVFKSFPYAFKDSNCLLWMKGRFEPYNASGNILRQFENFQIYKGLYGKPLMRDWVARDVFPF